MPVETAADAISWARREHEQIERLERALEVHGDSVILRNNIRDARRKRGFALMSMRVITGDRTIPENGTDEEIAAFLQAEVSR